MKIIDGKKIATEVKNEIAKKVQERMKAGQRVPHLAAIIVGDDGASKTYIGSIERSCREVGFTSSIYQYSATITEKELLDSIDFLNRDDEVDGYIIQLPLPKHINKENVIAHVDPNKDVDCFHPINSGKLFLGEACFLPATPYGTIELMRRSGISAAGKHCVVLGRSNIVGTPVANLLSRKGFDCTVTMCHSKTQNLKELCLQADILVVAIGKPEFVTADMVKEGAVVVDVGIHRVADASKKNGYRVIGDVNHAEVDKKCSWVTPVPGGVGPLTIVSLLQNTLKAYHRHESRK